MPQFFTVYVLYSVSADKHYVGYTGHLLERFKSHNSLGKDWTARYRPWIVIHTEIFEDASAARTREKWLKSGVGREMIKSLQHTF